MDPKGFLFFGLWVFFVVLGFFDFFFFPSILYLCIFRLFSVNGEVHIQGLCLFLVME